MGAGSRYQWLCFPTWNAFIPAGHCHQRQRPHATPAAGPAGVAVNGPEPASSAARCDVSDVEPRKDVLQLFKLFRAPTTCRKLKQVSRKKKKSKTPAHHNASITPTRFSSLHAIQSPYALIPLHVLQSTWNSLLSSLPPSRTLPHATMSCGPFSMKPALRVPPRHSFHMV